MPDHQRSGTGDPQNNSEMNKNLALTEKFNFLESKIRFKTMFELLIPKRYIVTVLIFL